MKFRMAVFLIAMSMSGSFLPVHAITTVDVVSRTLSALSNCLEWRWVGNCQWLSCDLDGCSVETSMKVRHYIPDLLAVVHRYPGELPWVEVNRTVGSLQRSALKRAFQILLPNSFSISGGEPSTIWTHLQSGDLRFFEATVIGHPLQELPLVDDRLFCTPSTRPLKPYYQSVLDAIAWRLAPLESLSPKALTAGYRYIGTSATQSWGTVFPRSGFVLQQSPVKAAAIVAQRACNIAIEQGGTHVSMPLEALAPFSYTPSTLDERDTATGMWQMIHPITDTACELFGSADPTWDANRLNQEQSFMWNLWRPYECCEPRGEKYLGAIHF